LKGHRIDCTYLCLIQHFVKAEGAGNGKDGLHPKGHCLLIPAAFILGEKPNLLSGSVLNSESKPAVNRLGYSPFFSTM